VIASNRLCYSLSLKLWHWYIASCYKSKRSRFDWVLAWCTCLYPLLVDAVPTTIWLQEAFFTFVGF